jgi:hypothetical protein
MTDIPMYHQGSRQLQDRHFTRKLADRLVEVLARNAFTNDDRAFIESRPLFFLATADAGGRPDCSHKGGLPGFVRVVEPDTLAFPDYDGNGMFKSLGNVLANAPVGMLFIDFESPRRAKDMCRRCRAGKSNRCFARSFRPAIRRRTSVQRPWPPGQPENQVFGSVSREEQAAELSLSPRAQPIVAALASRSRTSQ